jgi:DNA-binding MarR family transcriptional regulator
MSRDMHIETIQKLLQSFSVHNYIYQSKVSGKFNLHPTDLLAIHYLSQHPRLSTGQLGERLGLSSGATTAMIDRLIANKLVSREADPADRRRIYVALEKAATSKLKEQYSQINRQIAQVFATYSEAELKAIVRLLVLHRTSDA